MERTIEGKNAGKEVRINGLTRKEYRERMRLSAFRRRIGVTLLTLGLFLRCGGKCAQDKPEVKVAEVATPKKPEPANVPSDKVVVDPPKVPEEKKPEKPIEKPKKVVPPQPKKAKPIVPPVEPKKEEKPVAPPEEPKKPETREEAKFRTEVLNEKEMPVLVVFFSSEKDSPHYMKKILVSANNLAERMLEKVKIYTVDASQRGGRNLALKYGVVQSVWEPVRDPTEPCIMIFKNGIPAENKMWCYGSEGGVIKNGSDNSGEIIDLTNKHIRNTVKEVGTLRKESEPHQ